MDKSEGQHLEQESKQFATNLLITLSPLSVLCTETHNERLLL